MGALAQFPVVWAPEDDFRIKNAIEGGASLESLAKGAVQFSRRFSLQEIQKRWVSILYDPVVSAEVANRLTVMEHNPSNYSQKSLRPGGLKDTKCNANTIKTESIRDHYYSTRKRIHSESIRSLEMELAGEDVYGSDHINEMDPLFNTMLRNLTSRQMEHQQLDAGLINHRLPQVKIEDVTTSSVDVTTRPFHVPQEQYNHESSLAEQTSQLNGDLQENKETFFVVGFTVDKTGIHEDTNICGGNGVAEDQQLAFDQTIGFDNIFDGFEDLLPGSVVSVENLDFPSPLPEISFGDFNFEIPDTMMHVNNNPASDSHNGGDQLGVQEGDQVQVLDVFMSGTDSDAGSANSLNQGGDPTNSGSDDIFAEIYGLLDDDADNKPPEDNPLHEGFKSNLLTSPIIADGDVMASKASDLPQSTTHNANRAVGCQAIPRSDIQMSSFSVPPRAPAQNDFTACISNTEDPLIPNNDDITLPFISSSVKDLLERYNHGEAASKLFKKDHEKLGKREYGSKAEFGQFAPRMSCNGTSLEGKLSNSLPEAGTQPSHGSTSLLPDLTKRGHSEMVILRGSNHCDTDVACPSETNGLCNKSDNNTLGVTPDDHALNQRVDCDDPIMRESIAQRPLSKFGDQECESDDEIPYYSDIEEMVLEMDLDPEEQDIELKERGNSSKYQSSDAKRTIMRLEQAAHSFMQRTIAHRGALAVIYGRNIQHYIKKSEVLLGRLTDDSQVDIDLGAEGRAHTVSRRQAVIKLEADGNFYIRNLGKRPIYKNNLEVGTGKTTKLQSGNLIEIQRLTFIFEESPTCVRRHLRNLRRLARPINASLTPAE